MVFLFKGPPIVVLKKQNRLSNVVVCSHSDFSFDKTICLSPPLTINTTLSFPHKDKCFCFVLQGFLNK